MVGCRGEGQGRQPGRQGGREGGMAAAQGEARRGSMSARLGGTGADINALRSPPTTPLLREANTGLLYLLQHSSLTNPCMRRPAGLPPIVFVSMDQDPPMAARISACSARLRQRGGLTATVRVAPRVVYPTFFSDRRCARLCLHSWQLAQPNPAGWELVAGAGGCLPSRRPTCIALAPAPAVASPAASPPSPQPSKPLTPTHPLTHPTHLLLPAPQLPPVSRRQRQGGGGAARDRHAG